MLSLVLLAPVLALALVLGLSRLEAGLDAGLRADRAPADETVRASGVTATVPANAG